MALRMYVTLLRALNTISLADTSLQAKLFHEQTSLKMVTTKPIRAGEQIVRSTTSLMFNKANPGQWNTYGDLPNSDLLRRYGHVDMLPLPQGGEGNPADIVEIRADLVVSVLAECLPSLSPESSKERIEWWLEAGGDE